MKRPENESGPKVFNPGQDFSNQANFTLINQVIEMLRRQIRVKGSEK